MKKLFLLLASIALVFAMASCDNFGGSKKRSRDKDKSKDKLEKDVRLFAKDAARCLKDLEKNRYDKCTEELEKEGKELDKKYPSEKEQKRVKEIFLDEFEKQGVDSRYVEWFTYILNNHSSSKNDYGYGNDYDYDYQTNSSAPDYGSYDDYDIIDEETIDDLEDDYDFFGYDY